MSMDGALITRAARRAATPLASMVLVALLPLGAAASERPALGFGGGGVEFGVADPEHADKAAQYGGVLHLGSMLRPWLHLTLGVSYWSADIDRGELGSAARGTVSDLAFRSDLRWEAGSLLGLRPYLVTGLAAHSVGADIPDDASTERALSGLNWGLDTGVGLTTAARGLRYNLELRRRFVDDVDGWALTAGVGWFFPVSRTVREHRAAGDRGRTAAPAQPAASASPANSAATMAPAERAELARLKNLLRELLKETRAQRAELDSLRRLARLPASAPAPAGATPGAAPGAVATPATRLAELRQALARAADLSGRPEALRETADGLLLVLPGALLFGTASSELQIESRETLRRLALVMHRFPEFAVSVEGHADARGDPNYNLRLSRERAAAVARELGEQGIDARRLAVVGMGSAAPIADNATAAGRAQNRRVELRFRLGAQER